MTAAARDLPVCIREMLQTDLPAVALIEKQSYEFPWSSGLFRDCLLAGYPAVVVEQGRRVAGYAIMSVAAGEAHLLNICLARPLRGGGHGERLLLSMLERARQSGAMRLYLEVRPSNEVALNLYDKVGFEVLAVRRNYYRARHGNEDALVLCYRFSGGPGETPVPRA